MVDYGNRDSSFVFDFGSGGCAAVLEADPEDARNRATIGESAAVTDGSFSEDVAMPAGGSKNPASRATVDAGLHALDVPDPEGLKEHLADVSLSNFLDAADDALARSGYDRADQLLAFDEGLDRGLVEPGDLLCFLAAGTGYTWAATVVEWHG